MDFDGDLDLQRIREIAAAVTRTWDVPLLMLLARGPQRFMAIKRALAESAEGRQPDSRVLKDTLKRLADQGYVEHIDDTDGQPYAATERAQQLLVRLQAIVEYERRLAGELDNGTATHGSAS